MSIILKRYVRLSPSVLILAPSCYGEFDEEYTMDSKCPRCPVYNACMSGTEPEIRQE